MTFEKPDYIEHIRQGSGQILNSAASNFPESLELRVAACPDWDLGGLLGHQGFVYRYAGEHLINRAKEPLLTDEIPQAPEHGEELLDWFRESTDIILAALDGIEMDEEIWNWTANNTAGFWARRISHETSIHAWDATQAAEETWDTSDDWGADGVDEYLQVLLPSHIRNRGDLPKPSGTLHLHRTDENGSGPSEWLCDVQNDELKVDLSHSKGDVAIQGSGRNLHLWVWGRLQNESPEIQLFGDAKVAEEWMAFCP